MKIMHLFVAATVSVFLEPSVKATPKTAAAKPLSFNALIGPDSPTVALVHSARADGGKWAMVMPMMQADEIKALGVWKSTAIEDAAATVGKGAVG